MREWEGRSGGLKGELDAALAGLETANQSIERLEGEVKKRDVNGAAKAKEILALEKVTPLCCPGGVQGRGR